MTAVRRRLVNLVLWVLPIQLLGGLVLVLHAQHQLAPETVVEQKLTDDAVALDRRVLTLENLHLEGRLAVLDALSERSWRIELLVIGLFGTTAGSLFMQVWMHRLSGRRRDLEED